jgi:hypothetical protein
MMGAEAIPGGTSGCPHPLWWPYEILCLIAANKRERLCAAPFHASLLMCVDCPKPHDLGLVFFRTDRPVPLWCLYVSDEAGSA